MKEIFVDAIHACSGKFTTRVYTESNNTIHIREHWCFENNLEGQLKAEDLARSLARTHDYILRGVKERVVFT